ncbi:MAG: PHP domain-containing protein [Clostridia bacterium]|nr:PHP domain-containing protein [Clostridia bacterium]
MYNYELHLHTSETSHCGHVCAADQVRTYHEHGYTGLCVTDHLHMVYINSLPCKDDWKSCMDKYLKGYRAAKAEGEKYGMDIILGAELRFPENDSDYLVYGIDEQWLYDHPYMMAVDHKAFFDKFKNEVLIIHAHPYRNCDIVFWDSVHGLEVVNCNPRHDSRNELALQYYREHPYLIPSVGSDAHRIGDECRSALLSEKRIRDSYQMKEVLTSGQYRLWCPTYENIISESEEIRQHV